MVIVSYGGRILCGSILWWMWWSYLMVVEARCVGRVLAKKLRRDHRFYISI